MSAVDKKSLIEARVNSGLLGQWYPVAKSVEVKAIMPYGAKVLRQKLVLWRGADGRINCIEDVCPPSRRAARLWRYPQRQHRLPGPQAAEEITGTVAFLLSQPALRLTGQVPPVNNGFVFT